MRAFGERDLGIVGKIRNKRRLRVNSTMFVIIAIPLRSFPILGRKFFLTSSERIYTEIVITLVLNSTCYQVYTHTMPLRLCELPIIQYHRVSLEECWLIKTVPVSLRKTWKQLTKIRKTKVNRMVIRGKTATLIDCCHSAITTLSLRRDFHPSRQQVFPYGNVTTLAALANGTSVVVIS